MREQEPEAEHAGRVEQRDRREDRRRGPTSATSIVVREPEPLHDRAARDTEDRHRQDLGREDEAHLPGRARS